MHGNSLNYETEFEGKVALVTAAAGAGVGQAVARRIAAGGGTVVVTDVHERRTAEVTAALRIAFPDVEILGIPLDVGDFAAIDRVVADVRTKFDRIDILVNNAAINWAGPIWDYPVDRYQRTMRVNVDGAWYLAREIMPLMRERGSGVVINISSPVVQEGGAFGGEPVYAISKGALETMTRALAQDGGRYGIRVNTVSVGIVGDSKFMADHPDQLQSSKEMLTLGEHVVAADVAEAVAFFASELRSGRITGDILSVNSGMFMRI